MPLDPSIALGFRLPQAEQPFQQMGQMLTLRNALRQSEQSEMERQRKMAFEKEVAALPENERTLENITKIAARHAPADKVFQYGQQSLDRQAQTKATQEAATARLQQAATMADRTFQLKIDQAKDAREKAFWQQQRDQKRLEFEAERARQGAGRLFYETGIDYRGSQPSPAGAAPQAPVGVPGAIPGVPQNGQMPYAAAMQQFGGRPQGSPPFTVETEGQQPIMSPQTAPQAAAPQAPWPLVPMDRPPGQGVPGVRAQAAPVPPMPPEIAALPPKARQQWLLQQTKPSIAGAGAFTPETLQFVARQYLTGDRQAVQGFARNATARIALQNAIVEEATKQGMKPEDVAAQIADFAGTMAGSRTVGQRAANISLAATEAQEMLGIVKETSDRFARTNFVPWNMALRAYESGTGSPEIAEFGAAVNALVNVYARAINPTGVPTVSDKEHARAVLNTVQSPAQVDAVLGIIKRELEIAKKAPSQVQESTRRRLTDKAPNVGTVMDGYKFKGGNPADKNNWEKL